MRNFFAHFSLKEKKENDSESARHLTQLLTPMKGLRSTRTAHTFARTCEFCFDEFPGRKSAQKFHGLCVFTLACAGARRERGYFHKRLQVVFRTDENNTMPSFFSVTRCTYISTVLHSTSMVSPLREITRQSRYAKASARSRASIVTKLSRT